MIRDDSSVPVAQRSAHRPTPFKRTLGEYPLRSRAPVALLAFRARRDKPTWGRGTGCAFAVSHVSEDPRARVHRQWRRTAWGGAVPNVPRLLTTRTIKAGRPLTDPKYPLVARSSVLFGCINESATGCAQVPGIDFDQTFCATMRPTSLRALAAIANSNQMKMRRWDFIAAYLQGSLERDEVVYCHALYLGTRRLARTANRACVGLTNQCMAWLRPGDVGNARSFRGF
eukprot:4122018-Pleurochrysis_carterae.AAC.2